MFARVWWLSAGLVAATAAIYVLGIRRLEPLAEVPSLPWWLVGAAFLGAEVFVVHLQLRREAHTFSLSEIPLVVGLFALAPGELLLAQVAGAAVALVAVRRQSPVKLVFNLAHLAFEAALAVLVLRGFLALGPPLGWAGWAGALAATTVTTLAGAVALFAAISIAEGRAEREALPATMGAAFAGSVVSTVIGLLVVELLVVKPEALWLLLIVGAALALVYRAYTRQLQRHAWLERLYDATRSTQRSIRLEEVIEGVLEHAREMFRADVGEIVFFAAGDEPALRSVAGPGDRSETMQPVVLDPAEGVWARVASEGRSVLLPRPIENERLAAHFGAWGVRDAMVAPLVSGPRVVGMMTMANRRGDVTTFDREDLRLLETLAGHVGASLENARLVRRLEESLAHLTEMNRLKDDFVATVSHELRTPLTSVQGTIKTLLRAKTKIDPATEATLLQAADRQSDRLRQLIENLLIVGRIESRQLVAAVAEVDVPTLVERVLEEVAVAGDAQRLRVSLDARLPRIQTDEGKLHQILVNLVENALKYSPGESPVTVVASPRVDGIELSIEDGGPGIPADLQDRVFDRFFQVDQSSTRRVGGAGLGLYICRQLAEALGGRLWLERSDASGSVFSLWLPLRPVAAPAEEVRLPA